MGRFNQYSRAVRYSSYARNSNYSTARFRKSPVWKNHPKPGVYNRRRVYPTHILNEILPLPVSTGREIIHSGYVSMPEFGTSFSSRKKKYILFKGVEMQGSFRIMNLPVELAPDSKEGISMEIERTAALGVTPGLQGMVTLFVVLDKRPRGESLSKFEDIFEFKEGGYRADALMRNAALERYSLIIKKRNVFQSSETSRIIPFRATYVPKERVWVRFHDYEDAARGGNFKNIAANGLLYYVVYESHAHSICWANVNSCVSY